MKVAVEPTITKRGRITTVEWEVGEREPGEKALASLVCSHHGKAEYWGRPEKVFTASLTRIYRKSEGGFTHTSFALYSGVNILSEPVERFSAKALAAFVGKARSRVEELLAEDHPKVAQIFGPEEAAI